MEKVRYTDQQRELAFRVWSGKADRNAAKTARLLVDEEDGFEVTRQTVHAWSLSEDWERRADKDLYSVAPRLRYRTQSELVLAAPESARFLRQLVNLDPELMSVEDVVDKNGEILGTRKFFDDKVLKLRAAAAQLVLDRVGFSPVGVRELGDLQLPPDMSVAEAQQILAAQDHESLAALERGVREQTGIGRGS